MSTGHSLVQFVSKFLEYSNSLRSFGFLLSFYFFYFSMSFYILCLYHFYTTYYWSYPSLISRETVVHGTKVIFFQYDAPYWTKFITIAMPFWSALKLNGFLIIKIFYCMHISLLIYLVYILLGYYPLLHQFAAIRFSRCNAHGLSYLSVGTIRASFFFIQSYNQYIKVCTLIW